MVNARRSLSGKLMVVMLVTTAIALASAGVALMYTDLRDNRAAWAEDLRTEAAILALGVTPALSFNDREYAQRSLDALQARDSIHVAALYAADGSLFAQYARADQPGPPATRPRIPGGGGLHIDGEHVLVMKPVIQGNETLGTIYLSAQYDLSGRVSAYLNVLGAVMIIGLIAALLASSWLHRVVTRPMESMATVAQAIIEKRDYSFRAEKTTDDEVGVVIDAFNKMLDEVQSHARALETSEKLYRAIGESINYGVWVTDADGRAIYISDSFLRLVGLTMQQAANDGWGSVLHPDDIEETMAAWKECARTGNNWYREHRMMGVDGKYHSILAQGLPIRDAAGRVQRWAGINLTSAVSRTPNAPCSRPTGARTSSWPRSRTSCAIRSRPFAMPCASSIRTPRMTGNASGDAKSLHARCSACRCCSMTCSTCRASRAASSSSRRTTSTSSRSSASRWKPHGHCSTPNSTNSW